MRSKDESITWQNQSHLVQRYLENRKLNLPLTDMCRITDVMVEYVLQGREKNVMVKLEAVEKYLKELEAKQ